MKLKYQQLLKATRSPETAPRCGGWVTPAGSMPAAMLAWQAGEDDEVRRSTPAVAMIDAEAPLTCSALKGRAGHSGVKNVRGGNWPSTASLRSEGISHDKVEGNAVESWIQRNQLSRDLVSRAKLGIESPGYTLGPKGMGTRNPGNRMDNAPGGQKTTWIISGSPGRMPHLSPTANCHDGTWKLPRALGRKTPAGFQPHARGRQVAGQAEARGNARDMQNPVTRHRNTQNQANP